MKTKKETAHEKKFAKIIEESNAKAQDMLQYPIDSAEYEISYSIYLNDLYNKLYFFFKQ